MNISKAYPSNYLKASDIESENLVLTIAGIAMESVGQEKEQKPVLYFQEIEKGVVLNKTNANTISQVLGTPETDNWIGQKIALYAAEVEFQGKTVESIRVRLRAPRAAQPQPQAQAAAARPVASRFEAPIDADDIPF
jgi:hypothetical protein